MDFPVFDLHCDTALALLGENLRSCGSLLQNDLHIDLQRAKTLPSYAQCFACFTTTQEAGEYDISPVELFERELATVHRELERNPSLMRQVFSAEEIEENKQSGMMSAVLTVEGPAGFDYDPALLEDLYKVGFRITTLCWNESNPLTGSHITGGGLTDLGREYVKEAQRVGMIVDVSHISDEAFWDIMEISNRPVIASHSNSRSVCNVSRNLTDDMFRAICRSGGVAGINLYRDFVGDTGDFAGVCRHILHFLSMDPEGKHIALGGDLDGCDDLVSGFAGVQDYPALAKALQIQGVSDEIIENIFWNNALGVIKNAVHNHAQ